MDPQILEVILERRRSLLFGYSLDIVLYGILTVQLYLYYTAFPNDKKITKAVVGFIYSVDTAQTIVALFDFYKGFCAIEPSNTSTDFQWLTVPLGCSLVATATQLFYARRIYILSKGGIVTGVVIVLALAQLALGLVTTVVFHGIRVLSNEDRIETPLSAVGWGAVGMVCDLVIAVYMFWCISRQMRRASKTTRTQVALTRIKRLLLETGFLTSILATSFALLFLFVGFETYMIPSLPLGKLYSNSMLVLLNNRFTIADGRNQPLFEFEIQTCHLTDIAKRANAGHGTQGEAQVV